MQPHLHAPNALTAARSQVCLFVKDHAGEGQKEAKKRLQKLEKNGGVAKVIGISKLKTKYESFEAKRQLCALYDLFLADDRVLPMMPKLIGAPAGRPAGAAGGGACPPAAARPRPAPRAPSPAPPAPRPQPRAPSPRRAAPRHVATPLAAASPCAGKSFFKKKKQPIPVDLRSKDWAAQIRKACASTHMFLSTGSSISIRAARGSFGAKEVRAAARHAHGSGRGGPAHAGSALAAPALAAAPPREPTGAAARPPAPMQVQQNVEAVVAAAVQHVPKKWANVQGVFIKTAESVALPVYQSLPDAPTKIDA